MATAQPSAPLSTPSASAVSHRPSTMSLFGGGEVRKAETVPVAGRPKGNLADFIFKFCMRSAIVLGGCYFIVLAYIAVTYCHSCLERLQLLPFFVAAVTAPLYGAAMLHEGRLNS